MKYCRDCGKQVSECASRCPHCGAPHPGESEKQMANDRKWLVIFIILYVVLMILVYANSQG